MGWPRKQERSLGTVWELKESCGRTSEIIEKEPPRVVRGEKRGSLDIHELDLGAGTGEMAQWVNYLLHKRENLSSNSPHPCKNAVWQYVLS